MKYWILPLIIAACLLTLPAAADYYRYIDKDGNVRFTDDISKIPPAQRPSVQLYEDPQPQPDVPAESGQTEIEDPQADELTDDEETEIAPDDTPDDTTDETTDIAEEQEALEADEGDEAEVFDETDLSGEIVDEPEVSETDATALPDTPPQNVQTAAPGDDQSREPLDLEAIEKDLTQRKNELDQEYQNLMRERDELIAEDKKKKTKLENIKHNQKINVLNERIESFIAKRAAYIKDVRAFNTRVEESLNETSQTTTPQPGSAAGKEEPAVNAATQNTPEEKPQTEDEAPEAETDQ